MKPNLILLHGALGSRLYFKDLKERLTSEFEVFALDFEGHGEAKMEAEEFSIDLFSDNLIQFIIDSKIEKTHLFGYSMGGGDKMVSRAESQIVANLLPNGRFYSLSNQPHPIEKVDLDVLVDYIQATIMQHD